MTRPGDALFPPARAIDTIVLGGVLAGILDIADAFIVTTINGGTPTRVLQAIASGVLGRAAYQGGAAAAALGLALHFVIALGAASAFLVISRLFPAVLRYAVWSGIAFGLAVWAFMYYTVLPITFSRPNVLPAWPPAPVGKLLPPALWAMAESPIQSIASKAIAVNLMVPSCSWPSESLN